MIQAIMLIALGFLIASLIGVLLAPSLWSRATRLSKKRLESALPLTLAEIEAAQDQLRATYAVRVRRLESSLASAMQKAANQLVDNSRLQMRIVALNDQIAGLDLQLSERRNAATVLEQAITKRFPELDREITAVKAELHGRASELQDLTSKLARREEELAAAQDAAASYQEELQRLHQVLERSASDRSGRRVRRASQWNLEDYKAEYDRLNLELSKLRQQLSALQDRDSQQVGVIKGELQQLAELILASAQSKSAVQETERSELSAKRFGGQEIRRERPIPWRQNAQQPLPLTARLKLNAEASVTESVLAQTPRLASPKPDISVEEETPAASAMPASPLVTVFPGETVQPSAPKDGQGETGGRAKILQEVVTADPPRQGAEGSANAADSEPKEDVEPPVRMTRNGAGAAQETAFAAPNGTDKARPRGSAEEAVAVSQASDSDREAVQEGGSLEADDKKAVSSSERSESAAGNGARHAAYQNGEAAEENLAKVLNLDALEPDLEKIGPHHPTLLERLRGVHEDPGEGEKAPPLPRA